MSTPTFRRKRIVTVVRTTVYKIEVLSVSKVEASLEAEQKALAGDGVELNDTATTVNVQDTNEGIIEINFNKKA